MSCIKKKPEQSVDTSSKKRQFFPWKENPPKEYADNTIRTTGKYTRSNFIFVNLYLQFKRLSNVYFLIISILQFMPVISSVAPTTWIPLVLVLLVNMIKEWVEYNRRAKMDKEVNEKPVSCVSQGGKMDTIQWKHVEVGSVLVIKEDEQVPADVIILVTADSVAGLTYVETANLDGETNLKPKEAIESTHNHLKGKVDMDHVESSAIDEMKSYKFETEGPNDNLHAFRGSLEPNIGITNDQIVYRGCTIRNSTWVIGCVCFTGMETKLMKNAIEGNPKRTTLDKGTNKYLIGIFVMLGILCIFCGVASGIWIKRNDNPEPWYLDTLRPPVTAAFLNIVTFLILMSALIPISLTVTMEGVKVVHALFINSDIKMYYEDPETGVGTAARARTSNLSEDLGRIEYIFSDKTGTLTQNVMEFMKCSIGGKAYGTGTTEIGRAAAKREGREIIEEKRPANLQLSRGDNFYDPEISLGKWKENPDRDQIVKFFTNLALCHTVMSKPKEGDEDESTWTPENVSYKASSPDEEALVIGARGSGFWFKRRIQKDLKVVIDGKEEVWELLSTNEFNSTRKRMSVVVKNPAGDLYLLAKGADSVMFERTPRGEDTTVLKDHLQSFANEGLRTLVLAQKRITASEYTIWNQKYTAAFADTGEERDEKLDEVANLIECDWEIVGATAIEDKLQDGVPRCISTLASAHIQIWILTGDKVETAINIAMACDLIDTTMHLAKVTLPDARQYGPDEDAERKEDETERRRRVMETLEKETNQALQDKGPKQDRALIIDGYSLQYALNEEDQYPKALGPLLKFAWECKAVVCCRVSPKQKAKVVDVMKTKHGVITLAIGDGANDVGMIQKAHIGVGISGREGVQAVQASDYAIAQFRYLQQLVLIHGRWDYQRISILILFSFYKNIAFSIINVWYGFYTGFSGVKYWDDLYQTVWNVFFTSLPIIAVSIFDKDMMYQATLHSFPQLYKTVQHGDDFNGKRFAAWTIDAIWCGLVTFFVPLIILDLPSQSTMEDNDKWLFSYTAYASIATAVNLRLALITKTWTLWTLGLTFLSIMMYFIWSLIYTSLPLFASHQLYRVFFTSLSNQGFWASLLLCQILALAPAAFVHFFNATWKPDDSRRVALFESKYFKNQTGINRTMPEEAWHETLSLMRENQQLSEQKERRRIHEGPEGFRERSSIMMTSGPDGTQEEFRGFSFSKERGGDPEVNRSAYALNPWRGGSKDSSTLLSLPNTHPAGSSGNAMLGASGYSTQGDSSDLPAPHPANNV